MLLEEQEMHSDPSGVTGLTSGFVDIVKYFVGLILFTLMFVLFVFVTRSL
jgi:hypothetical protein